MTAARRSRSRARWSHPRRGGLQPARRPPARRPPAARRSTLGSTAARSVRASSELDKCPEVDRERAPAPGRAAQGEARRSLGDSRAPPVAPRGAPIGGIPHVFRALRQVSWKRERHLSTGENVSRHRAFLDTCSSQGAEHFPQYGKGEGGVVAAAGSVLVEHRPVLLLYGRRGGTAPTINPDEVAFSYKRSD